jgi:hypothetical protein
MEPPDETMMRLLLSVVPLLVPPRATGSIPVEMADASKLGMSARTSGLNVGAMAAPVEGPAKTVFAACDTNDPVKVPVEVTGLPLTVKTEAGRASPTLVTVTGKQEALIVPAPVHVMVPFINTFCMFTV